MVQKPQNNNQFKNNHCENLKTYKWSKWLGLSNLGVSLHFVNPLHLKT